LRGRLMRGVGRVNVSSSTMLGEMATRLVYEEYRPDEVQRFNQAVAQWKDKRRVPKIEVKTEIIDPF
jgi:hypothetical protein